jgi:WD40 repeat protein
VAQEFKSLRSHLDRAQRRLLDRWYRRDDNAIPAEYRLLAREDLFEAEEVWQVIETDLQKALFKAAESFLPQGDPRRAKYELSVTHQEFRRAISPKRDENSHVLVYWRESNGVSQPTSPVQPQAARFMQEVRALVPPPNIQSYQAFAASSDSSSDESLPAFCRLLEQSLIGAIDGALRNVEFVSELKGEIETHKNIASHHARYFVGQQRLRKRVDDYLNARRYVAAVQPAPQAGPIHSSPVCVLGSAGSGKTATLAITAQQCERDGRAVVVYRFLGTTPDSSDTTLLLRSLCLQLAAEYEVSSAVPSEYHALMMDFRRRLAAAGERHPLILLLDGLDQLDVRGTTRTLSWLPDQLPQGVCILFSLLGDRVDANEHASQMLKRLPPTNVLHIEPLSKREAKKLLDLWLSDPYTNRKVTRQQRRIILDGFSRSPTPLYLKLSFEEARRWQSYIVPAKLGTDTLDLLRNLFHRLVDTDGHRSQLIRFILGYLAASHYGLTEDEILDLISTPESPVLADYRLSRDLKSPDTDRIPWIIWSRLLLHLEPYLSERSAHGTNVLSFSHHQFRRAVTDEFLDAESLCGRHAEMAVYFREQGFQSNRVRDELAYHQTEAGRWTELEQTFTSISFLYLKAEAVGIFALLQDFEHAFSKRPYTSFSPLVRELFETLVAGLAQLNAFPRSLPNLLLLHLRERFYSLGNVNELQTFDVPPLLTPDKPLSRPQYHVGMIIDATLSDDGSLLATAGADGSVMLRDLRVGTAPRIMVAGESAYNVVKFSSDSRLLAVGRDDGVILVFAAASGNLVAEMHDHELPVLRLTWAPDGAWLASAGGVPGRYDWDVRIWDTWDWSLRYKYKGGGSPVRALEFSPDSTLLVTGGRGYNGVHFFDVAALKSVESLPLQNEVYSLAFSPDGRWLYAATDRLELLSCQPLKRVAGGPIYKGESLGATQMVRPKLGLVKSPARVFAAVPVSRTSAHVYSHDPSCRLVSQSVELQGEVLGFASTQCLLLLLEGRSVKLYEPDIQSLRSSVDVKAELWDKELHSAAALAGEGLRALYLEARQRKPEQEDVHILTVRDISGNSEPAKRIELPSDHSLGLKVSTGHYGQRCLVNRAVVDVDSGLVSWVIPGAHSGGSLRPDSWLSENEDLVVRGSEVAVLEISPAAGEDFKPVTSAMLSRAWYIAHGIMRLPLHTVAQFGRDDKALLTGTHDGYVFVYVLGEKEQRFGVFPPLGHEVSAAAWSDDETLVAVGTDAGQVAIGFIPDEIPTLGRPLSWLYLYSSHASRVEHISFYPGAKRHLVISADSNRVMSVCDPGTRDTVQLLLPARMLAMRRVRDGIMTLFAGEEMITTWALEVSSELSARRA